MQRVFLFVLACEGCLASGEARAQVGKTPETISRVVFTTNLISVDIDTTGLLSKPALLMKNQVKNFPFALVDNPPRFKGGEVALKRFIGQNLRVPPIFTRIHVEGWTRIQFIVDVDGYICKPVICQNLYQDWDDEVLRVVKLLDQKFEPATYNGELVAAPYLISVPFFLE